jgi:hypothetical protein
MIRKFEKTGADGKAPKLAVTYRDAVYTPLAKDQPFIHIRYAELRTVMPTAKKRKKKKKHKKKKKK